MQTNPFDIICMGETVVDLLPQGPAIGGAPLNVAYHLKRMGRNSAVLSAIGKDENGTMLHNFMYKNDINALLQISDDYPSGVASVQPGPDGNRFLLEMRTAWNHIPHPKKIPNSRYIYYGSLAMNSVHNQWILNDLIKSNPQAIPFLDLNIRDPFYSLEVVQYCLKHAKWLKVSDEEVEVMQALHIITGSNANTQQTDSLIHSCRQILHEYELEGVICTRGAKGSFLVQHGEPVLTVDAAPLRHLVDTVGAGDSFTARFIHGMMKKEEFMESLQAASQFAAQICQIPGAIPPEEFDYTLQ
jgi:fructokinase